MCEWTLGKAMHPSVYSRHGLHLVTHNKLDQVNNY